MRKAAILLACAALASQAAVGLGFTVSPRLLFPLHKPYEDDTDIERGVMAGFSFSFDLRFLPGFSAGPYFGGLFYTDNEQFPEGDAEYQICWSDLVIGAILKYSIPTGGPIQPWLSVALGYGSLSAKNKNITPFGTFEFDCKNTGGFGLDAGIGLDYRFSEMFSVGFGVDFHMNTADKVEYEWYDETYELELEESPVGLGFAFDVGINL